MPIEYNKYPDNWKLMSYFIRFIRAKNKCEWCHAENYKPHPETGSKVILTVAHFDHNINNNSYENLFALCQRCHLNHDKYIHLKNKMLNKAKKELETGQKYLFL